MVLASSLVIVKPPFEIAMKGIKIYGLWLPMILISITFFSTAAGLADILPVSSFITGTFEMRAVNKSFSKIYPVVISAVPVITQTL